MDLIFGGAYQGKLDYAKAKYNLSEDDIYFCSEDNARIDFSKRAVYGMEKFLLACIKEEKDPAQEFEKIYEDLADKIVICTDISQGLVPVEPKLRLWREETGRAMVKAAKGADTVTRVFAGLPLILKTSE